ncbi:ABC-type branched-chain amino acid transport system, substrate-binding protein [Amycolatopsis sacchari]|uniref:ABC-type branched-chain amino acid transport system, substrate-binding protein n=1 Tax=Amycolatopsis sacchari TaxID=115433 RepID=A0A1I3L3R7_9PSEU|nr:ABC transporter substrate-binding protein [Amycolatopsis sacchari]SFI79268.1 ABC-type branched-chain amino acid transport system, substrate-binding protein [Amycolatopsis sacchari]
MRKRILLAVAAVFAATACASGGASGGSAGSPVLLAAMGPNSGPEYNPGPQSTQNQYQALADAWNALGGINGHPIKLEFHDTQSSAQTAVTIAQKVRRSGAKAFFSCCFAAESQAANTPLENSGPVTFNAASPLPTPANSYVFDAAAPASTGYTVIQKFLGLKQWKRVALITDTTPGEDAARDAISAGQGTYGYQLVTSQIFDVSATSVATQVAQVAQSQPDAIVLFSTGPQVATVFSALRAANLANVPVVLADGELNRAILAKFADSFPAEVYAPAAYYLVAPADVTGDNKAVLDHFLKAQGFADGQNDNVASYLVDDFGVVVHALRALGPDASNEKIRDYIQNLKGYQGIGGTYNFSPADHRGTGGEGWGVVRIEGGTLAMKPVTNPGVTALAG